MWGGDELLQTRPCLAFSYIGLQGGGAKSIVMPEPLPRTEKSLISLAGVKMPILDSSNQRTPFLGKL